MKQEMMLGGPAIRLNKENEISLELRTTLMDPNWGYDRKLDGTRMVAVKKRDQPVILFGRGSRKDGEGRKQTIYNEQFPEIVQALEDLNMESFKMDGELVIYKSDGFEDFNLIQKRTTRVHDIQAVADEHPAVFMVFDAMEISGIMIDEEPLHYRRHLIEQTLKNKGSDFIEVLTLYTKTEEKRSLVEMCIKNNLEGVMVKDMQARYKVGRAKAWIKAKRTFTEDVFPLSYTPGTGRREQWFGALKCYYWKNGEPVYATNVGGGMDDADLTFFKNLLKDVTPTDSPEAIFAFLKSKDKLITIEIEHYGIQKSGRRHPNMLRIRNDKDAEDCDGESR